MQTETNIYELLCYCWKHKLFSTSLSTETRSEVEVIDQGLFDRRHRHRFFNAKVKIDGRLMVGNVIVVNMSQDFFESFDDYKRESTNVILVLCHISTQQCIDSQGHVIPVVQADIPDFVQQGYDKLMSSEGMMLCHERIKDYTPLMRHAWLAALETEHMEEESECVRIWNQLLGDWQLAYMVQLFKAFGFGVNEVTMLNVFNAIPRSFFTSYHIDDLFQVEAVLFGQAGLLELEAVPEKYHKAALNEGYFAKLRYEWLFLARKFQMPKAVQYVWKPLGRGQYASPHVLLSMLANLIYMRKTSVGQVKDAEDIKDLYALISTHATPYWQMHSHFGKVMEKSDKYLSRDRQNRIIMTCHVPLMFAYGQVVCREDVCDRAFDIMEQMKPYKTPVTAWFERFGFKPQTAGDTVAICRLKYCYCGHHDCLRCRFGYEFIKNYKPIN